MLSFTTGELGFLACANVVVGNQTERSTCFGRIKYSQVGAFLASPLSQTTRKNT